MNKRYLILMALGVLSVGSIQAVYAQDDAQEESQAEVKSDPRGEEQEAAVKETRELLNALVEKISDEQQKHFFLAYSNHNLISTTEVVRTDVKDAIKKCGDNNPEMKDDLDARFKVWDEAIKPVLKEAQGNLDNMIIAQDYAKKKDIRRIFDSADNTREKTSALFNKVPVTTADACEYLLDKMDDTQANLIKLLRSTLVSFPQFSSGIETESEKKDEEKAP